MVRRSSAGGAFSRRRMGAVAFGAAMLASGLYGLALMIESFAAGAACCGATWPHPNPVKAERMAAITDRTGTDEALQKQTALDVLGSRPIDHTGWARLAYAETLRAGGMTPQGLAALKNSYIMAAYSGRNAGWRSAFALQYWPELDQQTQALAIAEFKALRVDGRRLQAQKSRIAAVTLPVGRAVAIGYGLANADDFQSEPGPNLRR